MNHKVCKAAEDLEAAEEALREAARDALGEGDYSGAENLVGWARSARALAVDLSVFWTQERGAPEAPSRVGGEGGCRTY